MLMKTAIEMRILKKVLLKPTQRFLIKKQASRAAILDESDCFISEGTDDPDHYNDRDALESQSRNLINHRFETELDRKLALGLLANDYTIDVDKDGNTVSAINDDPDPAGAYHSHQGSINEISYAGYDT